MSSDAERLWDGYANEFDDEADHGLRDPKVLAAWQALLARLLPEHPARVADLGCGTGSLAVLLAEQGNTVSGLDISNNMIHLARSKAQKAEVSVDFVKGDAAAPPFTPATFDVVLARHILWVFEDPDAVLRRWVSLLAPNGRLILIEGRWSTGAGLRASECRALVLRHRAEAEIEQLTENAQLWGAPVDDDRYVIVSLR
jgi:2-polyprenyl-3-methyl-5-hydroxy-6-metoxy-1,4-benzoquinol methylase